MKAFHRPPRSISERASVIGGFSMNCATRKPFVPSPMLGRM
jgi:hypothetical protein